jgi:hypothetical protein
MKILFSTSSFGFLRNFQSTIRLLAERGHELHLIAERTDAIDGQKMVDALKAAHPAITAEFVPSARHRLWYALGTGIRASLDYWRYLDSRWDHSPKLRRRAEEQAPAFAVRIARMHIPGVVGLLQRCFRAIDRVLPAPDEIAGVFRRIQPDLLLLTPLLYFRSHQVDHVRCARALGIKTMLGVGSWDHLTTKGLIHETPDRILVWNHAQAQEAVDLHRIPADQVVVTGAQAYDHWFDTRPALDRRAFCERVGLDPAHPILLYLCSSPFIAPHEVGFVRKWIAAVRSSADARLKQAGLLVRPHPQNARQWEGVDLSSEFAGAALWPKTGVNPIGGVARSDYFDSIYHAAAVVGVNTSAMIESGIIGRPVYTIIDEQFAATQEGTLHFQHLKKIGGGLVHTAANLDAHVEHVTALLADGRAQRLSATQFVEAFIRPHGLDTPATPRVVEEIERFAAAPALAPRRASAGARALRAALVPLAVLATVLTMERAKLRSIVLHWTRPARLMLRALMSRLVYAWRFVRRLPGVTLRLAKTAVRYVVVLPTKWLMHRAKTRVHTFLVWRKGGDAVP